jgi:catalase
MSLPHLNPDGKMNLETAGAHPEVISLGLGVVKAADGTPVPVDKTSQVAASVLYDAVYVAGGAESVAQLAQIDEVARFIVEAFKHGKAVGATGEGVQVLPAEVTGPGVITGADPSAFAEEFAAAIGQHRFPEREGARGGIGARRS